MAPVLYNALDCNAICTVNNFSLDCNVHVSSNTQGGAVYAVTDFEEADNDAMTVFGTDGAGVSFCCYVAPVVYTQKFLKGVDNASYSDVIHLTWNGAGVSQRVNLEEAYVTVEAKEGPDAIEGSHYELDCVSTECETLEGNAGGDTIHGNPGVEIVYGGVGADVLYGEIGEDTIFGGSGNDRIYGGTGDDSLFGDGDVDRIWGGDGDDSLKGGAGNDILYGELHNDELYGEDDDDVLYGAEAVDVLYGGGGNDVIYGGTFGDFAYGESGDDLIYGEEGSDILLGDQGFDRLSGGAGNDSLFGGIGVDYLDGGSGTDIIRGGAGDDTLCTGTGTGDDLEGEADNDLYWADVAAVSPTGQAGIGTDQCCNDVGAGHSHGAAWAGAGCYYLLVYKPVGCL